MSQLDIKNYVCNTQVPSKSHVKADILDIYSFYVKVFDTNRNGSLAEGSISMDQVSA